MESFRGNLEGRQGGQGETEETGGFHTLGEGGGTYGISWNHSEEIWMGDKGDRARLKRQGGTTLRHFRAGGRKMESLRES